MAARQPCSTRPFSLSSSSSSARQQLSQASLVQTTMAITRPTALTEPISGASFPQSRPTNASTKAFSTFPTAKTPTESMPSRSAEGTLSQSRAGVASATLFWSFHRNVRIKWKQRFGTKIACFGIRIDGFMGF